MESTTQQTNEYVINASGQSLGRVASEAAYVLMGKNDPAYTPHIGGKTRVHIENASELVMTEKKKEQKEYVRFSGYPGGQKVETMRKRIERKGIADVVNASIYGMLPANKLRKDRMKRVRISE